MNKTKAFSKAAVIIAMIGPLSGCEQLIAHMGWNAIRYDRETTSTEDTAATDANDVKQPTSGTASTDVKNTSKPTVTITPTSTIETTGNGVTQSNQLGNDNNLGISNSIPITPR